MIFFNKLAGFPRPNAGARVKLGTRPAPTARAFSATRLAALTGLLLSSTSAWSQVVKWDALPPKSIRDENGVDLMVRAYTPETPALTLGDPDLSGVRHVLRMTNASASVMDDNLATIRPIINPYTGLEETYAYTVNYKGQTHNFYIDFSNDTQIPYDADGTSLVFNYPPDGNSYISAYFTDRDGTVVTFQGDVPGYEEIGTLWGLFLAKEAVEPNGKKTTYAYRADVCVWSANFYCARLSSVSNNLGSQIKYEYYKNDSSNLIGSGNANNQARIWWYSLTKATAINSSVDYCSASADSCSTFSQSWPSITSDESNRNYFATGEYYITLTDPVSRQTRFRIGSRPIYSDPYLKGVKEPGYSYDNITLTVDHTPDGMAIFPLQSYTKGGISTYYSHTSTGTYPQVTASKPDGSIRSVKVNPNYFNGVNPNPAYQTIDDLGRYFPIEDRNGLSRAVQYAFDDFQRPLKAALSEGNYTQATYDARGNITAMTAASKPGSGLASLVLTAGYDTTCANPKTCNKPNWTRDAKGNQTDYTYDATHGGVLTETLPADANGVRPQKRYSYTQLTANIRNSSGTLVPSSDPVWMLTRISECVTATSGNPASCVGTANEKVTTYAYASNNLWRTSETTALGDGSQSVTQGFAYDNIGNVTSIDGPRTDVNDVQYFTYDAVRRKLFEIGADPGGGLPRQMVRHVYDGFGDEIRTEYGTGTTTNGSDFVVNRFDRITYNGNHQPVKREVVTP